MERNNDNNREQSHQPEDEDRLSMLPDDILLSILMKIDMATAARTSAISTRWRELPWLMPELSIGAKDFLPFTPHNPAEPNLIDKAMVSVIKATRSFLAKPRTISALHLNLYLNNHNSSSDIGLLVGDAIDGGWLKDLDLDILDGTSPIDFTKKFMVQLLRDVHGFFTAHPTVLNCLTKLTLWNVPVAKLDMHHLLFDCCKQLKHLTLCYADAGCRSIWAIDAPNSKLSILVPLGCRFRRLDLVCLPKLEKLELVHWDRHSTPVSFGYVPSLGDLDLTCGATRHHRRLKLSELLHGATGIHTLTLGFNGEILWMQPEIKQLRTAFSTLRKLSVTGIFVEFDILWATAFLEAAPSVEILHIEVCDHACDVDGEDRMLTFSERTSPQWEIDFGSSKNTLLKELQFIGFRSLEQQFSFIEAVLQRAPNLQKIVLSREEQCDSCDALDTPPSRFPVNKDEQETVAKRITDGMFSPQVIFSG